eukprot:NODE_1414_length_1541_cov_98.605228_g1275_i0.p1 GENE.NODE_1414_length_1541_cov_98.605228_g1275_i0~~NODE_1414_length_1541_cov_98.605228_g1275_i0.p1  ORF type:complete len:470 (+),score=87.68 NODE_1414_length_1541_cov_98.605228_g1275_i0:90-1412(+)
MGKDAKKSVDKSAASGSRSSGGHRSSSSRPHGSSRSHRSSQPQYPQVPQMPGAYAGPYPAAYPGQLPPQIPAGYPVEWATPQYQAQAPYAPQQPAPVQVFNSSVPAVYVYDRQQQTITNQGYQPLGNVTKSRIRGNIEIVDTYQRRVGASVTHSMKRIDLRGATGDFRLTEVAPGEYGVGPLLEKELGMSRTGDAIYRTNFSQLIYQRSMAIVTPQGYPAAQVTDLGQAIQIQVQAGVDHVLMILIAIHGSEYFKQYQKDANYVLGLEESYVQPRHHRSSGRGHSHSGQTAAPAPAPAPAPASKKGKKASEAPAEAAQPAAAPAISGGRGFEDSFYYGGGMYESYAGYEGSLIQTQQPSSNAAQPGYGYYGAPAAPTYANPAAQPGYGYYGAPVTPAYANPAALPATVPAALQAPAPYAPFGAAPFGAAPFGAAPAPFYY